MLIIEEENQFRVTFAYNPKLVDLVKRVPGHRWNPEGKYWYFSKDHRSDVLSLQDHGFKCKGEILPEVPLPPIEPLPELSLSIPLKRDLYEFQRNGTAYILEKKRVIAGDQPGLGKTIQSIAAVTGADAFPSLVVCPSSLKINWQREWEQTAEKRCMILNSSSRLTWQTFWDVGYVQVFITNYESLKKYFVLDIEKKLDKNGDPIPLRLDHIIFRDTVSIFKSVIFDESHRLKSFSTQQTKFAKGISRGKEYIICLTGTPVINKPKDLASQLGIIDRMADIVSHVPQKVDAKGKPKDPSGYRRFMDRYCEGGNGSANLKELNVMLSNTCFFRREKSEVLKQLPPKVRQVIYCELDAAHRHEYNVAVQDLEKYLKQFQNKTAEEIEKSMRGEIMVRILKLKAIAARGKVKDVCDFIDDIMESGEKLVLFGHLKQVLGEIKMNYRDAVSITGDDDTEQRQIAIDSFQKKDDVKLCVCSIQAGGVGITLTAASRVAFIELHWHPAIHDQCEDRCHRIGQEDSVQCTYFIAKNTIDEQIYKKIEMKREMANTIVGSTEEIETDIIDTVINLFNQKNEKE